MLVLAVVLVEYESNENRLMVLEKVDLMVCHTCNISIFLSLSDKESVIVSEPCYHCPYFEEEGRD